MLTIADILDSDAPCIIEVDGYVPLSFKTYTNVLAAPYYFRIGNFRTSLLEIGIENVFLAIRKMTLSHLTMYSSAKMSPIRLELLRRRGCQSLVANL